MSIFEFQFRFWFQVIHYVDGNWVHPNALIKYYNQNWATVKLLREFFFIQS